MNDVILHTRPFFDDAETRAVINTIESRMVNEGDLSMQLISKMAQLVNSAGGVSVSTGTLGLHLALKTMGVESSADEVIIPNFACRSLYDCVRMAGGTPVLCDINLDDYSLSIDSVLLRQTKKTRAIILPHMYGCPADIDAFDGLKDLIIEDCAHSAGAEYKGGEAGSFCSISAFSFEGSKLIAAGEGGCVLANSRKILERLNTLRYGLNGHFAYQYRLSDLIAAVALAQLDKLPFMVRRRKYIASLYYSELKIFEQQGVMTLPKLFNDRKSVYYRFVVLCNHNSDGLIDFANQHGVLIRKPLISGCISETYKDYEYNTPNAKLLASNGASLPIYPGLKDAEIAKVVDVISSFYKNGETG